MLPIATQLDLAAHSLDDAGGDGKPETRAVVPARERAVALLEFVEDPRLRFRFNAGPRVPDNETGSIFFAFDDDRDPARLGEFHRIAGEVQQHLAEPRRIARDPNGNVIVDVGGDFDTLGLRAGREQLDDVGDEFCQIERNRFEVESAGLDFREIQNFLDQRE